MRPQEESSQHHRWSFPGMWERSKRHRKKGQKVKDNSGQQGNARQRDSEILASSTNVDEKEADTTKSTLPKAKDGLWLTALERLDPVLQQKLRKRGMDESCNIPMKQQVDNFKLEAETLQKASEEKQWKFSLRGQEIIVRDLSVRIVDWAIKIGDVATKFAQDTTPGAGVLGVATLFLQQIQNFDTEKQALLSIADKVAHAMFLGQLYSEIYTPEVTANTDVVVHLHQAIVDLYLCVLTLLAMSSDLASSTVTQFCRSIFNNRQPSGILADLDASKRVLEEAVGPCEATAKVLEREDYKHFFLKTQLFQRQFFQKLDQNEWEQIRNWVSNVPYGQHHGVIEDRRNTELGDWFIKTKKFVGWIESPWLQVLLLQGSPGTGKTFLISNVVTYFKSRIGPEGVGFAYFFCNRGEDNRRKSLPILRSLVRQLASTDSINNSIRTTLRVAWEKSKNDGSVLSRSDCQKQLSECFAAYTTTFIVLDALDEVDQTELWDLLANIRNAIPPSANNVKLLFASRPGIEVSYGFQSTITIEAKDNHDDIKTYVEDEIKKFVDRRPRSPVREKEKVIVSAIMKNCDNMFLWAFLHIRHVLGCETPEGIDHALQSLPRGLDETYDRIYADFELLEKPDRDLAERAFKWVDAAPEPLTTEEILSAVRVEPVTLKSVRPVERESLISMCKNFLIVDSSDHWRYFHLSAREYLEGKGKNHNGVSRQQEAFSFCAEICFRSLLLSFHSENITFAQASPQADKNPDRFESPFHPANPFARHCQTYWPFYASKQDTESASIRHLEQFLGSPTDGCSTYNRWFCYGTQFVAHRFDFGGRYLASNSEVEILIDGRYNPQDLAKAPVFAVAYFALYRPLRKWWHNGDISPLKCSQDGRFLLTVAVQSSLRPLCADLISRGRSLDKTEFNLCLGQALYAAAGQNNIEMVEYLVQEGARGSILPDSMKFGSNYSSPVDPAAFRGNLDLVKYLVDQAEAPIGDALFWAAESHSEERGLSVIKYLIEDKKADPNLPPICHHYGTPLCVAASRCRRDIIAYLVEKTKTNVNALYKTDGSIPGTALCVSIIWGSLEDVKYLVENGNADVNLLPESGSKGSALATAASHGKLDIVKYLVETAGADVNSRLKVGEYGTGSALTEALARGELDIFYCLLPYAQVNLPLLYGRCGSAFDALFNLPWSSSKVNMVILRRFVEAGADVNMCHAVGHFGSPFVKAAFYVTDLEVIEYLVTFCKADIHARHSTGHYGSALAAAAHAGNLSVVKYLLDSGEDVNFKYQSGAYGSVLVAAAANSGNLEVIECLVNSGANPDLDPQVGPFGSALAAAAALGNLEQIAYLIEQCGANVNLPIYNGRFGSALAAAIVAPFDCSTDLEFMRDLEVSSLGIHLKAQGDGYEESLLLASASIAPRETRERAFGVCKYLVEKGANIDFDLEVGAYGNALVAASATGNLDQVKYLVEEYKADLNRQPRTGSFGSALAAVIIADSRIRRLNPDALMDSYKLISERFYRHHFPPIMGPSHIETIRSEARPMLNTMIGSFAHIMTFLVECGANPDLELKVGPYGSALAAAAATGSLQNVRFLVEKAKANMNLQLVTGDYHNACDAASRHGHDEIVEYLS